MRNVTENIKGRAVFDGVVARVSADHTAEVDLGKSLTGMFGLLPFLTIARYFHKNDGLPL